jgi:hypothetical protein
LSARKRKNTKIQDCKNAKRCHYISDGDDEDEGDDNDRSTRRHRETLISINEDSNKGPEAGFLLHIRNYKS